MPPELPLAHHEMDVTALVPVLVFRRLLVETYVHEPRPPEYLRHVRDEILAHPVVRGRGEHAPVVLQPAVVRRREVQLRNRLDPHLAQAQHLVAHLVGRPAPLDRQFRMARIDKRLANVDHDHVHALCRRMVRHLAPLRLPAAQLRIGTLQTSECGLVEIVREPVAPHVVPEVQQKRFQRLALRPRLDAAARSAACHSGGGRRCG